MPSLNRNEKVTCENCGIQTTELNVACHKKIVLLVHCIVPSVSVSPHNPKKIGIIIKPMSTAPPKPDVIFKFNFCCEDFQDFTIEVNTQHGFPVRRTNVDPGEIINDVVVTNIKEKLRSCQHLLVHLELARLRYKVFYYSMEQLNAIKVNEKLDNFLNILKCAAKVNLSFAFVLKILKDRFFRSFYAYETIHRWIDIDLCAPRTNWQN